MSNSTTLSTVFSSITAGYIAGSVGLLIGHPLDSLKVALQTGGAGRMPRTSKELMILYSGVGPPLMTVGAVASVNFAIYDNVRRALFRKEINKGTVEGEKVRGGQEVRGRARS